MHLICPSARPELVPQTEDSIIISSNATSASVKTVGLKPRGQPSASIVPKGKKARRPGRASAPRIRHQRQLASKSLGTDSHQRPTAAALLGSDGSPHLRSLSDVLPCRQFLRAGTKFSWWLIAVRIEPRQQWNSSGRDGGNCSLLKHR
jgi:hypothetical protein